MIDVRTVNDSDGLNGSQVVAVDVYRAGSTIVALLEKNCEVVIGRIEQINRSSEYKNFTIVGESKGRSGPPYEFDNSPTTVRSRIPKGSKVFLSTSNGTRVAERLIRRNVEVFFAGFENALAVASYISTKGGRWTIVPCGSSRDELRFEDNFCSELILQLAQGQINRNDAFRAIESMVFVLQRTRGATFSKSDVVRTDIEYINTSFGSSDCIPKLTQARRVVDLRQL